MTHIRKIYDASMFEQFEISSHFSLTSYYSLLYCRVLLGVSSLRVHDFLYLRIIEYNMIYEMLYKKTLKIQFYFCSTCNMICPRFIIPITLGTIFSLFLLTIVFLLTIWYTGRPLLTRGLISVYLLTACFRFQPDCDTQKDKLKVSK